MWMHYIFFKEHSITEILTADLWSRYEQNIFSSEIHKAKTTWYYLAFDIQISTLKRCLI